MVKTVKIDPAETLPPIDPAALEGDDVVLIVDGEIDPGDGETPLEGLRGREDMPSDANDWLGNVKPSTACVVDEVILAAQAAGLPLELVWGLAKEGEHRLGYSSDYMTWNLNGVSHDARIGHFVSRYVWWHRLQLATRYLIWDRRIRNVEIAEGRWRAYSGESPHTDHVHVCRYPRTYLPRKRGELPTVSRKLANAALLSRKSDVHPTTVKRLQRALEVATGAVLAIDGDAGPKTRAAVKVWQRQIRSPATGILTFPDTYRLGVASGNFTGAL